MRGLIVMAALLILFAACRSEPPADAEPAVKIGPPITVITCLDCESHTVDRIIDGDTLDLVDGTRIRVFGINPPERGERCYSEATARLKQLAGSRVRLEDGPRLTDDFGRRLAYLFTTEAGIFDGRVSVEPSHRHQQRASRGDSSSQVVTVDGQ